MLRTRKESTVTVKGGSAVHEESGLADIAHILVEARIRRCGQGTAADRALRPSPLKSDRSIRASVGVSV